MARILAEHLMDREEIEVHREVKSDILVVKTELSWNITIYHMAKGLNLLARTREIKSEPDRPILQLE